MDPIIDRLTELSVDQKEILVRLDAAQKMLDKHADLLEKHNETLLRNTITVEEHHRRSLMLEEAQKALELKVTEAEDHVAEVKVLGKWARWAALALPAISAIYAILTAFWRR
jgi:hypothetical protein